MKEDTGFSCHFCPHCSDIKAIYNSLLQTRTFQVKLPKLLNPNIARKSLDLNWASLSLYSQYLSFLDLLQYKKRILPS